MKDRVYSRKLHVINKKFCFLLLMAVLICMMLPLRSHAASYKNAWVKTKGKYYYYGSDGKKMKWVRKIGEYTYYLDSKGVQRTGWRKIKNKYYYFRLSNGKGGYMVVNKKVNGIKLKKDGSAKLNSRTKRKVKLMVRCQKIIDKLAKPALEKKKKLWKAFEYTKNHFAPRNVGGFSAGAGWDVRYAEYMLNAGSGDCYSYGAVFAYLANAIGYQNVYACSSGGHGWCRINGLYYDPNWARVIGSYKCYGASRGQSGWSGRPAWATNELYVVNLSK